MKSKRTITWILAGILIFLSGVGMALHFSDGRISDNERNRTIETKPDTLYLHPGFPGNVVDGYVLNVDRDGGEIRFLVLTENMIINPPKASEELTIKVDGTTRFFSLDFATGEETEMGFGDIQIWDDLAVGTRENSLELFERDFFTATKITKRVGEPFAEIQQSINE